MSTSTHIPTTAMLSRAIARRERQQTVC
jgi:hypothetical protein